MNYSIDKIVVGELQTNCYILSDKELKYCAVIDPGAESKRIKKYIETKKLKPLFVINTHGHFDHTTDNSDFGIPVYIHKDDAKFISHTDKLLKDNDMFSLGNLTLKTIHTPGHTPGSISVLCNNIVFTGDTLFAGGVGRTDLPYGDEAKIITSIKNKLFKLPDDTKVYPGHGPQTTIGQERATNPYCF